MKFCISFPHRSPFAYPAERVSVGAPRMPLGASAWEAAVAATEAKVRAGTFGARPGGGALVRDVG